MSKYAQHQTKRTKNKMIKFVSRNKPKAVVDMIPMIDIVFQLVIFFMVATTFKTTTGLELNIPQAKTVTTISSTPLKVYIQDENLITIGDFKTDKQNFESFLQKTASSDKKSVVIYGNKAMEYQLLIDIMDILRNNGYTSIDLALKKK